MKLRLKFVEKRIYEHELVVEVESEDALDEIVNQASAQRIYSSEGLSGWKRELALAGVAVLQTEQDLDGTLDEIYCDDVYESDEQDKEEPK